MRIDFVRAAILGLLLVPAAAPAASIINGDFETGDLTGWTLAGSGSAKTSLIGVTPTGGTYQGYIETTGNFTVSAPAVASSLGVSGSAISGLGAGTPFNGTALSQSITVAAGDVLSFDWNFLTSELDQDPIYNDFAFFTISGSAYLLASHDSSAFTTVSPPPGFEGQTGWSTQTYTFTTAGTYTLGFGTLNVGDAGHNSALVLDDIVIPADAAAVPIPSTSSALSALLALTFAIHWKRGRACKASGESLRK